MAAAQTHLCVVRASGRVAVAGDAMGIHAKRDRVFDVPGIEDAAACAVGYEHTCVLSRGGGVSCWGDGRFGQTGSGAPEKMTPIELGAGDR
jgi:hypothetical protein